MALVHYAMLNLTDHDRDMNVDKFWRIYLTELPGGQYRVATHWGRNGSKGSSKIETYPSVMGARAFYDGKLNEKRGKGYEIVKQGETDSPSQQMLDLLGVTGTVAPPTDVISQFQIAAHQAVTSLTGPAELKSMDQVEVVRALYTEFQGKAAEVDGWMEVVNDLLLVKLES